MSGKADFPHGFLASVIRLGVILRRGFIFATLKSFHLILDGFIATLALRSEAQGVILRWLAGVINWALQDCILTAKNQQETPTTPFSGQKFISLFALLGDGN